MEAGGKQQDNTGNKNSGWWYKGRYSYSLSWTVAHNFVAYFKIYTGTTYHRQFSRDLKTGDYIALDEDQDGRIDHMGYVVQVSVIEATAEDGHIYEKYKVAQHTPDYLLWTTDEDNHWETYNCKGTYYIVRP